jgi:hypothetical protein
LFVCWQIADIRALQGNPASQDTRGRRGRPACKAHPASRAFVCAKMWTPSSWPARIRRSHGTRSKQTSNIPTTTCRWEQAAMGGNEQIDDFSFFAIFSVNNLNNCRTFYSHFSLLFSSTSSSNSKVFSLMALGNRRQRHRPLRKSSRQPKKHSWTQG